MSNEHSSDERAGLQGAASRHHQFLNAMNPIWEIANRGNMPGVRLKDNLETLLALFRAESNACKQDAVVDAERVAIARDVYCAPHDANYVELTSMAATILLSRLRVGQQAEDNERETK